MCSAKSRCQLWGQSLWPDLVPARTGLWLDTPQSGVSATGASGISVSAASEGGASLPLSIMCSKKSQLLWVTTMNEVTEVLSAGSWSGTAHVPHASFRGASVCIIPRLGWVWCDCITCQQTSVWSRQQSWEPGFRQGISLLGGGGGWSLQVFRRAENLCVCNSRECPVWVGVPGVCARLHCLLNLKTWVEPLGPQAYQAGVQWSSRKSLDPQFLERVVAPNIP